MVRVMADVEEGDVVANVCLVDLMGLGAVSLSVPTRHTASVDDKPKLFTCGFDSEMFDVGASQPASANEAITRRTRPAYFDRKEPHAFGQTQAATDHGGSANFEAVTIFPRDLNAGAGAIRFAGDGRKHCLQPITPGFSQQVVGGAQGQIGCDVRASCRTRALLGLGQGEGPCFVEFAKMKLGRFVP